MQLAMTVLRCPDHVAPEARTISGGEFHVGRGPDVDWVLPDPDRLLSKRHFAVAFRGGNWQVADTSTNGTFLNTDPEAIGRGTTRTLEDGDRLRLGAYEIEVRLVDQQAQAAGYGGGFSAAGMGSGGGGSSSRNSPFADPFADDPLAPTPPPRQPFGGFENSSLGQSQTAAQLPHDFDPLAPDAHDEFAAGFRGPTQSDHSALGSDAFTPPPIIGYAAPSAGGAIPGDDLLPDDWDKDLLEGISPSSGAPAAHPAAAPFAAQPPAAAPFAPQPAAPAFANPAFAPPPAAAPFGAPQPAATAFAPLPDPGPFGAPAHDEAPFGAPRPAAETFAPRPAAAPQPAAWAEPASQPAMPSPGGHDTLAPAAPPTRAAPPDGAPLAAWGEPVPAAQHPAAVGGIAAAPVDDLDDFLADLAPPPGGAVTPDAPPIAPPPVAAPPVVRQRAPRTAAQALPQAEADPFVEQTISPAAGRALAQAPFDAPVQPPVRDAAPPARMPATSPFDEAADFTGNSQPVAAPMPAPPVQAAPIPAAPIQPAAPPAFAPSPTPAASLAAAASPAPAAGPADSGALAAFFQGAQLSGASPSDPLATMTELGSAFRAVVAGLRAVLIARATIKGEFRIEQTMIRARGNNPLKFSANDDDALTALLGVGRRTDMSPTAAIEDSLRDMRLHEVATMAAMQVAVRAMLEELSPDKIRATAEQSGGMSVLPAQRKARAWDAFEARHGAVVRALVDDFDSIFGKSFARAYERALDEISQRERQ